MTPPTIGSLCSGYGGLDAAVEQVTGGTTIWHCEYEDAPSKLLAHHFPGVPNHHDVKTLTWAEHPVDVLTGGYPCQPFSGAGKRLGTDDPRHLFPWIACGIAIMRPPLVLLENVRGHLSLGFDVVLAELHRLGYDVCWTLLRAADVGAPHGRARLWIAARAREVGGWAMPSSYPVASLQPVDVGSTLSRVEWTKPSDGLFGPMVLPKNKNGSVPMWPVGVMVDGIAWETPQVTCEKLALLPTPRATRGGSHSETRDLLTRCCPRCGHAWDLHLSAYGCACGCGEEEPESRLMPTPRSTDTNGAGQHGDGGLDLRTAVSLLPTPKARDHKGCDPNPRGVDLNQAVHDAVQLLPTHRADAVRTSRASLTRDGQWSAPSLEQALELARGELPREFKSWEEVPGHHGKLLPTPLTDPASHNGHGRNLADEARLLPTPMAGDAKNARNSTATRHKVPPTGVHAGDTLGDLVFDGRLLPTPTTDPDSWNGHARDLGTEARLLPTPVAADGGGERASSAGWGLRDESRSVASAWGPYAAAVARWEHLTRPAPAPTEPGRSGPRLSPAFVEWMQGLDAGWVTDVPGLTRNHMLTMLGNGVVPQCAIAAYTLLGVTPALLQERAA